MWAVTRPHKRWIKHSDIETQIIKANYINTKAVDGLAPCFARPSAAFSRTRVHLCCSKAEVFIWFNGSMLDCQLPGPSIESWLIPCTHIRSMFHPVIFSNHSTTLGVKEDLKAQHFIAFHLGPIIWNKFSGIESSQDDHLIINGYIESCYYHGLR